MAFSMWRGFSYLVFSLCLLSCSIPCFACNVIVLIRMFFDFSAGIFRIAFLLFPEFGSSNGFETSIQYMAWRTKYTHRSNSTKSKVIFVAFYIFFSGGKPFSIIHKAEGKREGKWCGLSSAYGEICTISFSPYNLQSNFYSPLPIVFLILLVDPSWHKSNLKYVFFANIYLYFCRYTTGMSQSKDYSPRYSRTESIRYVSILWYIFFFVCVRAI